MRLLRKLLDHDYYDDDDGGGGGDDDDHDDDDADADEEHDEAKKHTAAYNQPTASKDMDTERAHASVLLWAHKLCDSIERLFCCL